MSEHQHHIDLFDLYINNALEANERTQFEERLINDEAFNKAFIEHQTLVLGIQDFGKIALKNYLKEQVKGSGNGHSFRVMRTVYAVAASVILIVGLVFVFQQYSNTSAKRNEIAIETPSITEPKDSIQKPNQTWMELEPVKKEELKEADMANVESEAAPPVLESVDDGATKYLDDVAPPSVVSAEGETYKIVSERKLSDTILLAYYVDNVSDRMMNKDAEKLEKAAATKKLPGTYNNNSYNNRIEVKSDSLVVRKAKARVAKSDKYTIEYWQSPINFKGYKLVGYTLQLYGLGDQPTNIKLYKIDDQLYLRMNGVVYELKNCTDGCAFSQTQDDHIRELILEQN